MTKADAIRKVMEDHGGRATLKVIYEKTGKYYPDIKRAKTWKGGLRGALYREIYRGRYFKKISKGAYCLIEHGTEPSMSEDIDDIATSETAYIERRKGQEKFRKSLLKKLEPICPITKLSHPELLNASHIKPWKHANDQERLDTYNGFLFSPTFDRLFDRGFISFSNSKKLLISDKLSHKHRKILRIKEGMVISKLPIKNRETYLEFHRREIFRRKKIIKS